MFNMNYKKIKLTIWITSLVLPLLIHTYIGYLWAKDGYDGKNCAGLLDAVWECNELEYYVDYIFNGFAMLNLILYYLIAVFIAIALQYIFRKYGPND